VECETVDVKVEYVEEEDPLMMTSAIEKFGENISVEVFSEEHNISTEVSAHSNNPRAI